MGEMVLLIVYELNQLFVVINNYCLGMFVFVKSGCGMFEMLQFVLEKIVQQVLCVGMIVKWICEFVKCSELKCQLVWVVDIVVDVVGLVEIEVRKCRIWIVMEIFVRMFIIYVDFVLIEQVLMNLMKNVVEVMVDVKLVLVDGVICVVVDIDVGFVDICVIDQGLGVDEVIVECLFELFYSIKFDGMGMGLNICCLIIELYWGCLWVVNNVELDGCIFGVMFYCSLFIGEFVDFG